MMSPLMYAFAQERWCAGEGGRHSVSICCELHTYFYRCDRGRSQTRPEWERAWNFFIVSFRFLFAALQLLLFSTSFSVQWEEKLFIIFRLPRTLDIPMAFGQNIFGRIYFPFLHLLRLLQHFSPFGIFGSCYFCDGCLARALYCVAIEMFARVGGFRLPTILRMWTTSTTHTAIHIRMYGSQRISANCNEYLHLNESSGDDRSANRTM